MTFPKHAQSFQSDQSQDTGPADQSETGTKQSINDRLEREDLQQCKMKNNVFFEHSRMQIYSR